MIREIDAHRQSNPVHPDSCRVFGIASPFGRDLAYRLGRLSRDQAGDPAQSGLFVWMERRVQERIWRRRRDPYEVLEWTRDVHGDRRASAWGLAGKVVAQERQGEARVLLRRWGTQQQGGSRRRLAGKQGSQQPRQRQCSPKAAAATGSATRTASAPGAASSKERSTASANCPVETTISSPSHGAITLKFAALREKMLSKAELDAYFQDLVALQREASTNVQNNGLRMYSAYGMTDTPRQRALLGCEGIQVAPAPIWSSTGNRRTSLTPSRHG